MTPRNQQAVLAIVRLVGNQDTAATVQQNTDEAVVAVRIGKALIYVHQERSTASSTTCWRSAGSRWVPSHRGLAGWSRWSKH